MLIGSVHPSIGALLSAHQSIGVPEPVKMFGTDEQKQEFLPRCAAGCDHRVPAHRARRRLRPGPDGSTATPTEDGDGVPARRREAVDHQRRRRRAGRGDGHGARSTTAARGGITAFVVETDSPGHHGREPQRVHGPEGHRERRHPVPPGPGAGREPARPGGRGAQDRPHHAQHRPAVDPGDVRGGRQVVASRSPASGPPSGSSGAGRSASTGRSRRRSRSSPRPRSRSRRCSSCPPQLADAGTQGHPDRGRAGQALVERDGLARSPTSWCRSAAAAATRPPTRWRPAASARCRPSRSCATCGSTGSSRARPRSCTC